MKKFAGRKIPAIRPFEKKLVKGSFDFIGVNHYVTFHVKDNPSSLEMERRDITADMALSIDCKKKYIYQLYSCRELANKKNNMTVCFSFSFSCSSAR